MKLYATAPGGTRMNITDFYRSVTWSGSYRQCGRQLKMDLLNARHGALERPNIPPASTVELWEGDALLFEGQALIHKQDTESSVLTVTALDRARYLSRNDGWYNFRGVTPETATRQICRDFGIEVGDLAQTGIQLTRIFAGVPLYKIIATLYAMASEQTGKRYTIRFVGRKLTVKAKSEGVPELVIVPGGNLMTQTTTVDASKLYTQVAIYNKDGRLIRTVDNEENQKAYGLFRRIITQQNGKDAGKTAQAFLEDNDLSQGIAVNCFGDVRMVTGEAAAMVDAFSGVAGRFWIDADDHTWKNHQHFTRLTLNFRNLMDQQTAGKEG